MLLGVACMQRALDGLAHSPLRDEVVGRDEIVARTTLVDDPDATRWSAEALVRVDAWSPATSTRSTRATTGSPDRDGGGRRVVASASGDAVDRLSLLAAGEAMTVRGWLEPLQGFDARFRWNHAVATLHVTDVVGVEPARDPLLQVANRARSVVLSGSTRSRRSTVRWWLDSSWATPVPSRPRSRSSSVTPGSRI